MRVTHNRPVALDEPEPRRISHFVVTRLTVTVLRGVDTTTGPQSCPGAPKKIFLLFSTGVRSSLARHLSPSGIGMAPALEAKV